MRRREFIGLLGASVTWPFAAMAQQTAHAYRLGAVSSSPRNSPLFVAMFDELRRRGFIMGQNLAVDWRSYGSRIDLIPEFAAELVKSQVDVVLVNGDAAIRAAQGATTTIPDPRDYRGHGRIGAGELAGRARRQYNRCQHLRDRA